MVDNAVAERAVVHSGSKRQRAVEAGFERRISRRHAEQETVQQLAAVTEQQDQLAVLYAAPPPRRAAIQARRATRQTLVPQTAQPQRTSKRDSNRSSSAKRRSGTSKSRRVNSSPSRATASTSSAASPSKRSAKYVEFEESSIVGVGPNGLGYGANLSKSAQLSLEWLRLHHSVRQLPLSKAEKERLVNGSGNGRRNGITYCHFPWCKIGDGWYVGEWAKKCKLSREQREAAHMPHALPAQTRSSVEEEERVEQSDDVVEVIEANGTSSDGGMADGDALQAGAASDGTEVADDELPVVGVAEAEEEAEEANVAADEEAGAARISPIKLQRKRGGGSVYRRHECTSSCWEMRGYGYQVNDGGVQYAGHFAGGALNDPHGVIIDQSGVYCGGVVRGADEGCGCFYSRATHDVLTGVWRQGQMHYGSVLYGSQNEMYTGAFRNNKQDGVGVFDVLNPAAESILRQHIGQWKEGTWNGVGRAEYAERLVTGRWLREGTAQGSLGRIEWVDEEGMRVVYVGAMGAEHSDGCGRGKLRWEERSAGEKRQHEHVQKQCAEAAVKRKKQHMQRRAGDWSSLAHIEEQQHALSQQVASISSLLASLPGVDAPLTTASSSLYTGWVAHSRAHGHGVRCWHNGDIFSGQWVDGVCNGIGSWLSQDRHDSLGSILYSGHWRNDKEHGRGTLLSSMPSLGRMLFHGRFVDGWLTGMGSVYFADSGQLYYVGRMAGGAFDGEGVMRLEDGSLYVGGFVDGTFKGKGRWVDTRECSVYTGRFKHDYKHGCGRLTIHQRAEVRASTADIEVERQEAEAVAAVSSESIAEADPDKLAADGGGKAVTESAVTELIEVDTPEWTMADLSADFVASGQRTMSDSDIVRALSAQRSTSSPTPEEALAACHHAITLPPSFGPAIHSYLAIFNRDKPVVRIVTDELNELLDEIEYSVDDADVDENGLYAEEQKDTTKEERRTQKLRKAGKSKVAVEPIAPASAGTEAESEAERREKEQDIGEAAADIESNGMLILQHYQTELDRIHQRKRPGRKPRRDKTRTDNASDAASAPTTDPSLLSHGTAYLRQSLSQPPPPLKLFAPADVSSHIRRIHLPSAIAACNGHNVCSSSITGQLPADHSVQYCVTCSREGPGDDEEEEKRVEVCAACRAAGCHRGHQLRPVRVVDKGMEGDPTNGEAALFWCHCSVQAEKCKTRLQNFSEAIDRAAMGDMREQQPELTEADVHDTPSQALNQPATAQSQQLFSGSDAQPLPNGADSAEYPSSSTPSPAPLKPSELKARSALFVQRLAPSTISHQPSAVDSASLTPVSQPPPPSSFRCLLSMLSFSSMPTSASAPTLPPSLPAPVRKAGPRWVKVDGKWVEEKVG